MHLPCLSYLLYTSALFGPFIRRLPNHHIPATLPTDVIDCSPLSHSVTPYPRLVPPYLFTAHCALRGPQAPLPPPLRSCSSVASTAIARAYFVPVDPPILSNTHPSASTSLAVDSLCNRALKVFTPRVGFPHPPPPPPTASFRSVSFPFRVRPQCTVSRARPYAPLPLHLRPE